MDQTSPPLFAEKHKNYHMKDEQLNKDGFKKFMKHEPCGFLNCKFSRTHNHIHCIRSHCEYVLHSSGQLFSHKRKHERKDNELAYRKYKLAQSMMAGPGQTPTSPFPFNRCPHPPFHLTLHQTLYLIPSLHSTPFQLEP